MKFYAGFILYASADWKQVKVLALTDHDTMAGVPAAMQAARKYGMRVIPGIEISAKTVHRCALELRILIESSVFFLLKFSGRKLMLALQEIR